MSSEPDHTIEPGADDVFDDYDPGSLLIAIRKAMWAVCPWQLRDYVEDMAQDAVLRVLRTIKKSEGKSAVSAVFLRRVAHSVAVDEIRRRVRKQESQMPETFPDSAVPSPEPDPGLVTLGLEAKAAIHECLAQMPEKRRRAVVLRLLGHTVPEAARILGWNAKRAENYVYRGLEDLRECLRRKGIES